MVHVLYKVHPWLTTRKTGHGKFRCGFYNAPSGAEPVLEWLKELPANDRKEVGRDLMRAQWRWPVGMPLCRPMGGGLWEVRSSLSSGRIARVLFCVEGNELAALHGFIKKTQKTPAADLELAKKRMKEVKAS
jgi:phage-related protein